MADPKKEIIKAAKVGSLERVKALVGADGTLVHARDSDGSTALHCAVWKGHQAIVAYLLSVGADVNAHSSNGHWGTTPLHAAAHANQASIAQLLVDHGADVNARDLNGKTPLYHTTFHKAKAAAKVLQNNGAE
ncbi:MAG TPA: ankyrin repeat domain-containing protein [Blastocatellia bacterium]|nr:ankyrin repeat domain-containing protein [Blastocatellia bacterium]